MKHFFYAVYVLFYTGAILLGGMFVGQLLERTRAARRKKSVTASGGTMGLHGGIAGGRKVAVMRKRE